MSRHEYDKLVEALKWGGGSFDLRSAHAIESLQAEVDRLREAVMTDSETCRALEIENDKLRNELAVLSYYREAQANIARDHHISHIVAIGMTIAVVSALITAIAHAVLT